MFTIITKDNINDLLSSFITKEELIKEFEYNPFGKYLVYKEEQVLGYIYYSDIYDRVEINQFEVKKEYRNQGIGNKLLHEFTKSVEKSTTLEVREDNLNAIHLYEKYGFKKKAKRDGYYQGIDGILMLREINNKEKTRK